MIADLINALVANAPAGYLANNKVVLGLPQDRAGYPQLTVEENWFSATAETKEGMREVVRFYISVYCRREGNGIVGADAFSLALSQAIHGRTINGLFIRVIGREPGDEPDASLCRIRITLDAQKAT